MIWGVQAIVVLDDLALLPQSVVGYIATPKRGEVDAFVVVESVAHQLSHP